jgi:hypothetical protein
MSPAATLARAWCDIRGERPLPLLMLWTAPPRGYDTGGYAGIQRDI